MKIFLGVIAMFVAAMVAVFIWAPFGTSAGSNSTSHGSTVVTTPHVSSSSSFSGDDDAFASDAHVSVAGR
ncbi:hypothetical protein K1I37_00170 [Alicyclobacillus acidoterrestris]|uniref:Uncharacterized protein n=1 Tax=Alicyclobacillus acidoterrestris (strain ATCC 49025 / DSM 3922 / CIP 106132 / NCIMB 13137 / GD3B) TaxID=1356854 RepID=A0A9E7CZT8_ALIAG|nr:hypothetical protein [Alicyclobacillus acidoterrestris]UNO49027.1 hypothetical protein K1I37_00170 [Alicyclobacillus acidoterrestris]